MTFYRCTVCGNMFEVVNDSGVNPMCCGRAMEKLTAQTEEAEGPGEKHVPCIQEMSKVCDAKCKPHCRVMVCVGKLEHPMEVVHHICFIVVVTDQGVYRKNLKAGEGPCAEFLLECDETILEVYGYCNVHGLWKLECKDMKCKE